MLPFLLTVLGVPGTLYTLLRLWWPTWYLDLYYIWRYRRFQPDIQKHLRNEDYIIDLFEQKVKEFPQKAFIIYDDVKYTYTYMDKKANQACRTAIEIGVKPGSVIAVLMYNTPGIVWTYLGFMKAGYQIAMINFNLRSKSLAHCINASGATTLIIDKGLQVAQNIEEILSDIPSVMVYYMGTLPEPKPAPLISWDIVMSRMSSAPIDKSVRKHIMPYTPHVLIYTSGTTGLPKPAIVSHIRSLSAGISFQYIHFTEDDIVYEPLPLYHSAALLLGLANVATSGASMVLVDKFSATHFWEDCKKYDVTFIHYIGEVCRYLLSRPKSNLDRNHKVRIAYGNGLRQDIWKEFQARFKIPQIIEFYGATECPTNFINITNKFGSCGRALPFSKSQVAFVQFDVEAKAPYRNREGRCVRTGPGEAGLFIVELIKDQVEFEGYCGTKEDNEKKLLYDVFEKGDKYYNSGDLMRVDKDNYVYFCDRVGDTFRWKGENVSTTEVSNVLTDLGFIQDANVYGIVVPGADGRAGMVAITLTDPHLSNLSEHMVKALSKHVTDSLPTYARPKFVRVRRELDMTSTFKQQKSLLVKEGYDVSQIHDPLYYLNPATQAYQLFDETAYEQIMSGKIQL